jgi:serine/threonine protein phosphatase 1
MTGEKGSDKDGDMSDQLFHVEYPANEDGRDFVVGDLHGEYDQLMEALGHQNFDKDNDRLFSVGDLIDRGPKSVDVVMLAVEPWFIPIQGNHEQMMLDAISTGRFDLWLVNGGEWYLDCDRNTLHDLVGMIQGWPMAITINHKSGKRVGICHAEPPVSDWSTISEVEKDPYASNVMVWGRYRIQSRDRSVVEGIDWVFCGHTTLGTPTVLGNTVFIDTGGYLEGGQLTVLNLDLFLGCKPALNIDPWHHGNSKT